jgi:hypothetical protein
MPSGAHGHKFFVGLIKKALPFLSSAGSSVPKCSPEGFAARRRDKPDTDYFSLYPFGHINGHVPLGFLRRLGLRGGWYGGLGGGAMLSFYTADGNPDRRAVPAFDITTGVYIGKGRHYVTAACTVRTDFEKVNNKLSLGYSYRFEDKENGHEEDFGGLGLQR